MQLNENHATLSRSHTAAVLAVGERQAEVLNNIASTLAALTAAVSRQRKNSVAGTADEEPLHN